MDEKRAAKAQGPDETASFADTTVGDRDVHLGTIVKFGVALLVAAIVVHVAMWLLSSFFKKELVAKDPRPSALTVANPPEAAPGPRLQSDPNEDMARLRAEETASLASYAWISADRSTAQIPIDRAVEIVLANGLPKGTGAGPAGTPEERAAEGAGGPPLASSVPPRAPAPSKGPAR